MLEYRKYECFVMQMLCVCVMCASCDSSPRYILYDLPFVNAGRGFRMRPYRRAGLMTAL